MVAYADYLLVITPPADIAKEITRYKQAAVNIIGHFEGMHSTPQLIITYQTRCNPVLAQPVVERIAEKLHSLPVINLRVNGFAFFNNADETKTIYAVIEVCGGPENWFELLQQLLGTGLTGFVPHIAVAKNIPATDFNKLWVSNGDQPLLATFKVGSLSLLQRETYVEYCEWRHYRELFLAGMYHQMF